MREITDADETMENNVSNNAGAGTDQDRREEINNAVSFNVILHYYHIGFNNFTWQKKSVKMHPALVRNSYCNNVRSM